MLMVAAAAMAVNKPRTRRPVAMAMEMAKSGGNRLHPSNSPASGNKEQMAMPVNNAAI
jgi:hypothetical protein